MAATSSKGKRKANLPNLIADFQNQNRELLETLRLFDVSNEAYERAMQALVHAPRTTSAASTQEGHQVDAGLVE